ncbi:transcriptional regulator [Pseudomonas sp. WS 5059]|jgi:DNA-binding winged helix-turn-helix (wHTH) protein|uniref:winged helix-turn-helix domain-containing protein n=1 Tax=unclassified Pseudomonas TaxID=196821 RepID=UPI0014766E3E|nr:MULTISPECIES: winged helix-turn-helix domain-containing protein [unclassified Pseudomonas]NMX63066.1 transcriptional regulator [Pseudomonas sp. WS 5079]NMX68079.1 transcriptional regulator [Pseudomonas sp. WS 5111]NMX68249.1 transcriptional regulator [Pseudomonas sp. WS 5111]NMX84106.1 transcriptional regulator [Pseudomonas sp. WS 5010]NMY05858.1 transcriptional regulator [Pseudomonas sp. WS 5059]
MVVAVEGLMAASLAFGHWRLQADGRLTTEGRDIQLPPKECHVLRLLLATPGVLVSKDHLLEQVWPHTDIAEESLTRCIYALRKQLEGDRALIATVYGRGYRFNGRVRVIEPPGPAQAAGKAPRACPACGWYGERA